MVAISLVFVELSTWPCDTPTESCQVRTRGSLIGRIFTDFKYFDGRGIVLANQDSDVLPFRGTNWDTTQVWPLFNEAIEVKGMLFQLEILPNVDI
jgi:hypothetical protein